MTTTTERSIGERPVDCQICGDCVPALDWGRHLSEHLAGKRPALPAIEAFERHATMTDRIIAFTVTLQLDTIDDDAEPIAEAIRRLRGVTSVVPVVADVHDYFAVETARQGARKRPLRRPVTHPQTPRRMMATPHHETSGTNKRHCNHPREAREWLSRTSQRCRRCGAQRIGTGMKWLRWFLVERARPLQSGS